MTRTQTGQLLGLLLLSFMAMLVPYCVLSFINWNPNPGLWSAEARVSAVLISTALIILRGLLSYGRQYEK